MTTASARTATPSSSAAARPGIAPHDAAARGAQRWQLAAAFVIWATSLAVVALWVSGGGVQAVLSLGSESLAGLGRLTGLISANLLLYQVLLMARVPLFERGFGRSGMVRLHRTTGIWSFTLLMAHIALIVVAYALQDGANLLAEAWDLTWNYPGMLLAVIAVIALVLVMITSARRARRRLRYESWHLLHLYGYLGVGLAIPHMLWTGADFVGNPVSTAYWWTLWVATAGCVLLFRIAVPLWRSRLHALRVAEVTVDGARGVTVRMTGRQLHRLRARAGQHFVWRFLDGPGWTRGHPFSLSAAPTPDGLQISARTVGDGSERLARLVPGTPVLIEGPYGHLTGARRTSPRLLMLAAGAGIAPLVALLESEPFLPGDAVLVTRDRDPQERMRDEAIRRLVAERGLVHYALDGRRARVGSPWLPAEYAAWEGPALLRRLAPGATRFGIGSPQSLDCDVYLCGPPEWMDAVRRDLRSAGFTPARIHAESFSNDQRKGSAS